MALDVRWYDSVCFAIVGGAILSSLWTLYRSEGRQKGDEGVGRYERLPVNGSGGEVSAAGRAAGHVGSGQAWRCCWRWMHPAWLLAFRGAFIVFLVALLVWDIRRYDASIFVYYTEWTFMLVIIYFLLGTIMSAHGCWTYSTSCAENEARCSLLKMDLERNALTINFGVNKSRAINKQEIDELEAGFLGYLLQAIYQICAGAVVLTDVVFWCIIVPFLSNAHFKLNMLMGCIHILNAVFLLLDTSFNSLPFPWFRLSYFVLWSCLYVIFQWIIHACGFTWWPYPFLELDTPWAPLWYFCLALMHLPCFGVYVLIDKAKTSAFATLFPNAYLRPSNAS